MTPIGGIAQFIEGHRGKKGTGNRHQPCGVGLGWQRRGCEQSLRGEGVGMGKGMLSPPPGLV